MFSSSVFLLLFFITVFIITGVVLIFIIVSIILDVSRCYCLHQFLHLTHGFIHFSFFSSSVFLLLFFVTVCIVMGVVLIFIVVSIVLEVSPCFCLHYIRQPGCPCLQISLCQIFQQCRQKYAIVDGITVTERQS